ncbi:MAG: hypothetical protein HY823_10660 [Acidobacteria bacterium]|nr:hypothetical protein [Acidobacteriota bacterium]
MSLQTFNRLVVRLLVLPGPAEPRKGPGRRTPPGRWTPRPSASPRWTAPVRTPPKSR